MRKAILSLAGASVLALVALAPTTTWAGRDWGVTVTPGGIHVGPKPDYRDRYYDRRRDRSAYRYRYGDDDWRYRRHRDPYAYDY